MSQSESDSEDFIQDHIEKGTITVEYCPMENMLADLMTKGLPCKRHKQLLSLMASEQITMPWQIGCHRMEITSGSEELRNFHGFFLPLLYVEEPSICYICKMQHLYIFIFPLYM